MAKKNKNFQRLSENKEKSMRKRILKDCQVQSIQIQSQETPKLITNFTFTWRGRVRTF